jgi:hypothetical protein
MHAYKVEKGTLKSEGMERGREQDFRGNDQINIGRGLKRFCEHIAMRH